MLLSIIIPAYNAEKYLDECLESCFRQDMPIGDYEVIIINDGSADKTLEVAERWASEHSSIRIISQTNKGLSMARNAGIENARGRYLMFLDSDDRIAENCLGKIAQICSESAPDMLRICAANVIDGQAVRRFTYHHAGMMTGREALRYNFQVCAPFAIYSRDFLKKNNLHFCPGIYHEDNLFTPIAYYLAEKMVTCNDVVYFVRQTPGSITRTANLKRSKDLLTVAGMLDEFASAHVEKSYRKYFDKQIADCLNVCLKNAGSLKDDQQSSIVREILGRREIFRHFLKSSAATHKIEGLLLTAFPKHMLGIYRMLDLIHR